MPRRPSTWKSGEKAVAKKLEGDRINRSDDYSVSAPDVVFPKLPFLFIDNKERRRFAHHALFEEAKGKYCKEPLDRLILTTHSYKSRQRYATIDLDFLAELIETYTKEEGDRVKSAYLTKEFEFAYGHRLDGYANSAKNTCGNPAGHGHTGILQVTVFGPIDPNNHHMVIDFKDLSSVVKTKIISRLDHSFLNIDVPEIGYPTAENMSHWIWGELITDLPNLYSVKVYETPTSYAEVREDCTPRSKQ